jgi:hypothetical protein
MSSNRRARRATKQFLNDKEANVAACDLAQTLLGQALPPSLTDNEQFIDDVVDYFEDPTAARAKALLTAIDGGDMEWNFTLPCYVYVLRREIGGCLGHGSLVPSQEALWAERLQWVQSFPNTVPHATMLLFLHFQVAMCQARLAAYGAQAVAAADVDFRRNVVRQIQADLLFYQAILPRIAATTFHLAWTAVNSALGAKPTVGSYATALGLAWATFLTSRRLDVLPDDAYTQRFRRTVATFVSRPTLTNWTVAEDARTGVFLQFQEDYLVVHKFHILIRCIKGEPTAPLMMRWRGLLRRFQDFLTGVRQLTVANDPRTAAAVKAALDWLQLLTKQIDANVAACAEMSAILAAAPATTDVAEAKFIKDGQDGIAAVTRQLEQVRALMTTKFGVPTLDGAAFVPSLLIWS